MAQDEPILTEAAELPDSDLEQVAGGGRSGAPMCPACGAGPEFQSEANVSPGAGLMGYKCQKCGKVW